MVNLTVDDLRKKWWRQRGVRRETNEHGLPTIVLPRGTLLFRAVPASVADNRSGAAARAHVGWAASFQTAASYAFNNDFENTSGENGKVIVLKLSDDTALLNLKNCDDAARIRAYMKLTLKENSARKLEQYALRPTTTQRLLKERRESLQQKIKSVLEAFDYAFRCKNKIFKESGIQRHVLKRVSTFESDAVLARSLCKLGLGGWANTAFSRGRFHEEIAICDPNSKWKRTRYEIRRVCGFETLVLTYNGAVIDDNVRPARNAGLNSREFKKSGEQICDTDVGRYRPSATKTSDRFLLTPRWRAIRNNSDSNGDN